MIVKTKFNVGDEVCFMKMNLPRNGMIVGINLKAEAKDRTNPDFARESLKTKVIYKVLPQDYEAAESDGCIYIPEEGVFANENALRKYLFG